jgi:hypothetical protein
MAAELIFQVRVLGFKVIESIAYGDSIFEPALGKATAIPKEIMHSASVFQFGYCFVGFVDTVVTAAFGFYHVAINIWLIFFQAIHSCSSFSRL